MRAKLSLNFKSKEELQKFLIHYADIVDLGVIEGHTLMSFDKEFLDRFKKELNLNKLFVESIKAGDLGKVKFCLDNGVHYRDVELLNAITLLTLDSYTPISVAFNYNRPEVVEFFLREELLNLEDIHNFILFLIVSFSNDNMYENKIDNALVLIKRLFNEYEIDPNFNGGQFLNFAIDGVYKQTLDLLKFLMDDRCDIDCLEYFYAKGQTYNINGLKYLNQFLNDNEKIDVNFFITGKFTETKD
jgi:hypothetical protein